MRKILLYFLLPGLFIASLFGGGDTKTSAPVEVAPAAVENIAPEVTPETTQQQPVEQSAEQPAEPSPTKVETPTPKQEMVKVETSTTKTTPAETIQKTATPAATVSCGSDYYKNSDGVCVHRPSDNPSGATAKCRDGSYSYSQHRRGTCSGHGGVSSWY